MKHRPNIKRREFIKTTAAAVAMPTIVPSSVLGKNGQVAPSNRIVMGGIGLGGRGRMVLRQGFLTQPDVQFVAIADVQEERREIIRRVVNREYGNEDCVKVRDMYEVLGRDDIDAVLIATGNRWHALASILATKAGKDVYCEKPSSMSVNESVDLAKYVGASGQVFQAGMQRRNVENFQFAAHLAHSGRLGKLHTVYAGILKIHPDAEPLPEEPEPDPEVCDWERWLGPAPARPYNKEYVRRAWRNYYDWTGGAGLPEWGSHTVDLCQWAAKMDETAPVRYDYEGETITGHYASGLKLVMRQAGFRGEGDWQVKGTCPVRYEGEDGWVEADDRGKLVASHEALLEGKPAAAAGTNPTKHAREFLDCVKSRKKTAVNEKIAAQSHIVCHAAAIGWQLSRPVQFDPATNKFIDDDEANRMCDWPYRKPWDTHLES